MLKIEWSLNNRTIDHLPIFPSFKAIASIRNISTKQRPIMFYTCKLMEHKPKAKSNNVLHAHPNIEYKVHSQGQHVQSRLKLDQGHSKSYK